MDHGFCVHRRAEQAATADQLRSQFPRVRQIAVVGECQAAGFQLRNERLNIGVILLAAAGRVPVVADGRGSNEMIDDRSLVELIADASECKSLEEVLAISRDDAGGGLLRPRA